MVVDEVRLLRALELRPHLQELLAALLAALLCGTCMCCTCMCGGRCGAWRAAWRAIRLQTAQRQAQVETARGGRPTLAQALLQGVRVEQGGEGLRRRHHLRHHLGQQGHVLGHAGRSRSSTAGRRCSCPRRRSNV